MTFVFHQVEDSAFSLKFFVITPRHIQQRHEKRFLVHDYH